MKKYFMIALVGLASTLFAETTLSWAFDGYAENVAKVVEEATSLAPVDTTVFVEVASDEVEISTEAAGMLLLLR